MSPALRDVSANVTVHIQTGSLTDTVKSMVKIALSADSCLYEKKSGA